MIIGNWITHPAADLMPLMEGQEFADLVESVKARGLEEPVVLWHDPEQGREESGCVLDGRNRLRACLAAGVEPRFDWWEGADPYEYVWALNVNRRHLEAGQRAMLRLDFDAAALAAAAELRQREANAARAAALKGNRNAAKEKQSEATLPPTVSEEPPAAEPETTRADLAKRAGVSDRTAQKAITVRKKAPELVEKVKAGEVSLEDAYKRAHGLVQHSDESVEWYTPAEYAEAARAALGGTIDLDPASCAEANEIVRAACYFGEEEDGLKQAWTGNVFLNPPGGLVDEFWNLLVALWRARYVERAIWVGFKLEQLQTLQQHQQSPFDFHLCVPRRRIPYAPPGGGKSRPSHASFIAFLPGRDDAAAELERFETAFAPLGRVLPARAFMESVTRVAVSGSFEGIDRSVAEERLADRPAPQMTILEMAEALDAEEEQPWLDGDDWMGAPAGKVTPGRAPAPKLCEHGATEGSCRVYGCDHQDAIEWAKRRQAEIDAEKKAARPPRRKPKKKKRAG